MRLVIFYLLMVALAGVSAPMSAADTNETVVLKHGNRFMGSSRDAAREKAMGFVTRDMAKAVGRRLQLPVTEINCPFKRCVNSLFSGDVDFVLFLAVMPERRQGMDFVQVWPGGIQVIFMAKQGLAEAIRSYDDLRGRRLGIVRGYKYFPQFDQDSGLNKISFVSPQQLPKVLQADRIDLFASYGHLQKDLQERYPNLQVAPYRAGYGSVGFIAVSKKSPLSQRLQELDGIVLDMVRDGTLDAIMNTYLPGERVPYPPALKHP